MLYIRVLDSDVTNLFLNLFLCACSWKIPNSVFVQFFHVNNKPIILFDPKECEDP